MDPQQELFIYFKTEIEKLGYSVFDGRLPPEGTPYPFVYLDGFRQTDVFLKNAVMGEVYPTFHIWHNRPDKRGTVSKMLMDIKKLTRNVSGRYDWHLSGCEQRILEDNTTKTPLVHAVLELSYKFC